VPRCCWNAIDRRAPCEHRGHCVQPIIPTRRKEPFDDPDWLFDVKYDGFRALCYIEQGGCRFISRNGNVLSRFEALGEQVAAVLDIGITAADMALSVVRSAICSISTRLTGSFSNSSRSGSFERCTGRQTVISTRYV